MLLSPTGPGEDAPASACPSLLIYRGFVLRANSNRALSRPGGTELRTAALLAQSESAPRIGPDAGFRQQRLPEWHGTGANIDARPILHLESSRPAVHLAQPPGILRRPRRQTASKESVRPTCRRPVAGTDVPSAL